MSIGVKPVPARSGIDANALALEREIEWFGRVLEARFQHYFSREPALLDIEGVEPPDLRRCDSAYARLARECGLGFAERIVLILALIPHLRPQALDAFFAVNQDLERGFTEFGGRKGKTHGGFLPSGETAAFILAGNDLRRRFELFRLFEDEHILVRRGIVRVETPASGEPFFSGALLVGNEWLSRFVTGRVSKPDYSMDFPAKLIETRLGWDDLVLAPEVMEEIENILGWLRHANTILTEWKLEKTLKPGFRSLFYGPPGTGKTLTATLIGASLGLDVYRIDLSMVVSKYIGETEKNLANVFDQAQNKNWILFFDEADALFGKRTQTSNANDRYANQEISYLLQRVEDFPGVVILATNLKANIDDAFARRFQSFVYFPMPDAAQRLRLWQGMFAQGGLLAPGVDLATLAEARELSGGAIANAVRYAAIRALRMERTQIERDDLYQGVARELLKEGRTI
jgi:hypothetical protein